MIARQGEKKQWHFAHASRSVYEQTDNECEYSFFVSVRLMARQVIGNSFEIKLPANEGATSLYVDEIGDSLTEQFIVTNEQRVRIDNIAIGKEFLGVVVDVYGEIEGYQFALYFTHPGRVFPVELEALVSEKCGIVEVSLRETYSLFIGDRNAQKTYLEKLRLFLAEDTGCKRWVFHPRYRYIRERAQQALEMRREKALQHSNQGWDLESNILLKSHTESGEKAGNAYNRREVKFQCLICGTTWVGIEPGLSLCPKCNTHLYGRRLGYVADET